MSEESIPEEVQTPIQHVSPPIPSVQSTSGTFVTWGTVVFTSVLISLASSVCSIYTYDRYFATKLAAFDLPGYLRSIQTDAAKVAPGDEKAASEKIQKSLAAVEKLITNQPRNVVILSGDVVLGEAQKVKKLDFPVP